MKRSFSYDLQAASILLLLLLLSCTSQGRYLNDQGVGESDKSLQEKASQKIREGTGVRLLLCRERSEHDQNCLSRRTSSRRGDNVGKLIPNIHEDYYGPGHHKSKHH